MFVSSCSHVEQEDTVLPQAKYIVFKIGLVETALVFHEMIRHDQIAECVTTPENLVSAGFCRVTPNGYACYGESTTLGISSRRDTDSKLLNHQLGVAL